MCFFYVEYFLLIILLIFSFALSVIIFLASYFVATSAIDSEKITAYECGFDPFEDARNQFDVRFYLVAILFIVFDIEASFLFPWSIVIGKLGITGFWAMFDFFIELVVGFFYVWKIGALDWLFFFFYLKGI